MLRRASYSFVEVETSSSSLEGSTSSETDPLRHSSFLKACRGEPTERVPVWFMRQAGRSLPEYRAARGDTSLLEAVHDPPLAAELTLQPVRRYGVDAAILFSDIVVPVAAVGFGVEIEAGSGPVVPSPFSSKEDLGRLRPLEPEDDISYVAEAARLASEELAPLGVPLIGFAGAPFTLASYLIEGGASRTYERTKTLMRRDRGLWDELLGRLAAISAASLRCQVRAGAQAVQVFDSWVGALSPREYELRALPASRLLFEELSDLGVPRIHFGVGTGELLSLMAGVGTEVLGVDWRTPLDEARKRLGPRVALQGNVDPTFCLAPWDALEKEAREVLDQGGGTGHIFNLGHGVLPDTDPAVLARLTDLVHSQEPASAR